MAVTRGTIANLPDGVHFLAHRGVWIGKFAGKVVTTKKTKVAVEQWMAVNTTGAAALLLVTKPKTPAPTRKATYAVPASPIRAKIVARVAELTALANKKFSLNMEVPKVEFFNRGKTAGRAYYMTHKAAFNEILAMENADHFDDTVIHEVGHLVTHKLYGNRLGGVKAHGWEFKNVCYALGGTGKTYHSYDVSSVSRTRRTVAVKCSCSTHMVTPQKAEKIASGQYTCRKCKGKVFV